MSEVLTLLQLTTQLGTVTGDLTSKANQIYVDQQLALKSPTSHVSIWAGDIHGPQPRELTESKAPGPF